MTYTVELSSAAAKSLNKLDTPDRLRIAGAIELLSVEPRPPGATMLRAGPRGRWRVRVGDHRLVYTIEDDRLIVLVLRIGHRREVYDR
ncbi:MAG: type II toxin-antitoxin system RelE/ParE family toxin [Candidatus Nanopelagicales bacterium]|jgi:mRNA interferase RelE/StbE|nr:type II toxin-antitoxin system RelE/ParE family toxin [Candidatus Nanopelagicales bacterium]